MRQFESFGLDTSNECLWRNGEQIALAPKPFAVLRYLVENPGRLITHNELLDALWPETYVQPQVLRTYMLELRKVLGDEAGRPRFIQTLPKRGYCFVAPVMEWNGMERGAVSTAATHAGPAPGIVNREEELKRLRVLAQVAANGQRQVVFVTGGAGIGKTALVDAFCRQASSSLPATAVRGQCVEGIGNREEYYPVMEALGQLCTSADQEKARRILSRASPAWLPALRQEVEAEAASGARPPAERMPGDLCGALEELAQEKPLILLFEDLHWADDSTLQLISALARRRAPAKLLVLATCRLQDATTEHLLKGLKHDLLLHRLCAELALAPFARSAVTALVSKQLGQETLPPGLDDFAYRHSEGNPLFAIAIVEHLIAERILLRDGTNGAAGWRLRMPVPEIETGVPADLAQMIELEIVGLSEKEQRILEAASLMNVVSPAWAVAAALEQDAAETEEACDELARRLHFVHRAGVDELPDGTCSAFYVFAHQLYREVLYQRQSAAGRAKRHIRIADRLGELFAGREANVAREMAVHYEAAGNWPMAANSLRTAARRAHLRQAYSEAAELLEHTVRIAGNMSEKDRGTVEQEILAELATARKAVPAMERKRNAREEV